MHNGKDFTLNFEQTYLGLRLKEGRLLEDDLVKKLPNPPNEAYFREWKIRARTAKRFTNYLANLPSIQYILEIGCGNGWFSHFVSRQTQANVIGADINQVELDQARRLFEDHKTSFQLFNIMENPWHYPNPDIIVFNASIQYFRNLTEVLHKSLDMLNTNGSIHILDSPFYRKSEVLEANNRSKLYFKDMGFPEMDQFYFHHTVEEISSFKPNILYRPPLFPLNKLIIDSPFQWLTISSSHG